MRPLVNGILLWMLLPICAMAQQDHNLVPNPSFEEYDFCTSPSQGIAWADNWTVPEQGLTPDYFNVCSITAGMGVPDNFRGHQYPVTGNAYVGMVVLETNGFTVREAITVALTDTLKAGERYVFRAYFSLAEKISHSVRTMGYRLSVSPLTGPTPIVGYAPTYYYTDIPLNDQENWMLLEDTVMAHGGERYLSISNFMPDSLSDTVFVEGELSWSDASYYYVDDVSLIALDKVLSVEDHGRIGLELGPNPTSGILAVRSRERLTEVWLTDLSGRKLWAFERRSDVLWETDIRELPQGIYLIEAVAQDGRRAVRKVVKAP